MFEKMPYGGYLYKDDVLSHLDCIQCSKCAISCPKSSIGYEKLEGDENCQDLNAA